MMRRPRQPQSRHLDFIRGLPCLICKNPTETEAAHVRMGAYPLNKPLTGVGIKPDDHWTVPLCSAHHREQHSMGEREFWRKHGKNPLLACLALWSVTGDHEAGTVLVERN